MAKQNSATPPTYKQWGKKENSNFLKQGASNLE
jgi:hypothetical protein